MSNQSPHIAPHGNVVSVTNLNRLERLSPTPSTMSIERFLATPGEDEAFSGQGLAHMRFGYADTCRIDRHGKEESQRQAAREHDDTWSEFINDTADPDTVSFSQADSYDLPSFTSLEYFLKEAIRVNKHNDVAGESLSREKRTRFTLGCSTDDGEEDDSSVPEVYADKTEMIDPINWSGIPSVQPHIDSNAAFPNRKINSVDSLNSLASFESHGSMLSTDSRGSRRGRRQWISIARQKRTSGPLQRTHSNLLPENEPQYSQNSLISIGRDQPHESRHHSVGHYEIELTRILR